MSNNCVSFQAFQKPVYSLIYWQLNSYVHCHPQPILLGEPLLDPHPQMTLPILEGSSDSCIFALWLSSKQDLQEINLCSSGKCQISSWSVWWKRAGLISPFRPALSTYHAWQYSITREVNSFGIPPGIALWLSSETFYLEGKSTKASLMLLWGCAHLIKFSGMGEEKGKLRVEFVELQTKRPEVLLCLTHLIRFWKEPNLDVKIARDREPSKTFGRFFW